MSKLLVVQPNSATVPARDDLTRSAYYKEGEVYLSLWED